MFRSVVKRAVSVTAAITILMTGGLAGTAYGAKDDMDPVSLARELVGSSYSAGQNAPVKGFDASGLVHYVYQTLDYEIPRYMNAQYKMDKPFIESLSDVEPGDIVFFGENGFIDFNGIYMGNNQFAMSSKMMDKVVLRNVNSYKSQFIGARRVLTKADLLRANLILDARKYLGTPYVFGAKYGQTKTFDCSSFVKTVFAQNNIELPRVSRNQALEGKYVTRQNLQVGDLVFFTTKDSGGKIGHVGIYTGDGMMIHTYGEGGVKYSTIESGWWDDHYVTARRLVQ
ncbi:MAG: gamma-glutamyl hydrolase [Paenibacillaceae bacterium]|nr:gamma-glutamyl hydrolase [Paenibacillaceae bacterium]